MSPGNNAEGGNVFTLQDPSTRSSLLGYLADHRYENFLLQLDTAAISAISKAFEGSGTSINEQQLAYDLGNVPLSMNDGGPVFDGFDPDVPTMIQPTMSPSIIHAALHPYRFVWIDACDTGQGNFCEAFGIPRHCRQHQFLLHPPGVESRAFIGFTQETGFDTSNSSGDPNGWPNRSVFLSQFLTYWLDGVSDLNTIVQNGQNAFGTAGYKMDSSAIIYGAYDLKRFAITRP